MRCFDERARFDGLDRTPFKFGHRLLGHPALALDNLAEVLPALPARQVRYAMKRLDTADDFEGTFARNPQGASLEQTIETLRRSDSYIMVSSPELHPSFEPLYHELMADVRDVMRARGVGEAPIDPQLYLFIASPGSITPFHIDRYSTFLMQFRGSKQVTVFEPWDERVVTERQRESYVAYADTRLSWSEEKNPLGTCFTFEPGEALHIPFVSGHHVRNGTDDVSISMSIIFNTRQSMAWRQALAFNHAARPLLGRVGLSPSPVGVHGWRDGAKSGLWRGMRRIRQLKR